MDDILAQLRRQREKQKEHVMEPTLTSSDASANKNNTAISVRGFRYDPILKRYLPKSAFKPNGNNDVCIQRIRQASICKHEPQEANLNSRSSSRLFSCGAVTDSELRMVVFRGCCIKASVASSSPGDHGHGKNKKRKKQSSNMNDKQCNIDRHSNCTVNGNMASSAVDVNDREPHNATLPCSEKSVVLLVFSLSYCSTANRRTNLASKLVPLCIARRLEVVPTVATKDMLLVENKIGCIVASNEISTANTPTGGKTEERKGITHKASAITTALPLHNWFSMLHPIIMARGREE